MWEIQRSTSCLSDRQMLITVHHHVKKKKKKKELKVQFVKKFIFEYHSQLVKYWRFGIAGHPNVSVFDWNFYKLDFWIPKNE